MRATLEDVREALGERQVAVARELTKLHEEIWRGTVSDALAHFEEPRGEFTLVIEGGAPPEATDAASLEAAMGELRASGARAKDAIASLAERFALSRREAYRLWHAHA